MAGGSMAYYLLKLFDSRPARWLDRVVVAAFLAAPAMAHVEMAKRRWAGRWLGGWVSAVGETFGSWVVQPACFCEPPEFVMMATAPVRSFPGPTESTSS